MNVGMLWFDNDTHTTLSAKVKNAAKYYKLKYGVDADLCFVHPSMFEPGDRGEVEYDKIKIRPNRLIQPGYLWIGVSEKETQGVEPKLPTSRQT